MTPHLTLWAEADSLVLRSGQLAFDTDRIISATDIEGQTRQTLENIGRPCTMRS